MGSTVVVSNVERFTPFAGKATGLVPGHEAAIAILTVDDLRCDRSRMEHFCLHVEQALAAILQDRTSSSPGHVSQSDDYLSKLRDALITEMSRFDEVFRTANGSTYFIGEFGSLRIKCDPEGLEWGCGSFSFEPLMDRIYFLSEAGMTNFMNTNGSQTTRDQLVGKKLELAELRLGAFPFEYSRDSAVTNGANVQISVVDRHLEISAGFPDRPFDLATHVGHEITQIIYQRPL